MSVLASVRPLTRPTRGSPIPRTRERTARVNLPCKNYRATYITPTSEVPSGVPSERTLALSSSESSATRLVQPQTTEVGRNPSRDSDWNKCLFMLHVGLVAEDAESGENLSRSVITRMQCRGFEAFLRERLGRGSDFQVKAREAGIAQSQSANIPSNKPIEPVQFCCA